MTKNVLFNELKYSKRSEQGTNDAMSLFGYYKNYQIEHYFPTNFYCHVMKRRLSTASRLFPSCSLPP